MQDKIAEAQAVLDEYEAMAYRADREVEDDMARALASMIALNRTLLEPLGDEIPQRISVWREIVEAQAVLDAEVVAIMEEWRTLSQPMSERLGDKHRLDAFVRVGQASADMLERLATERARQSAAIAKAQDEIADLCLPLAETDTDYDWGVKVGGYTCLTILDRHLAPARAALMAHTRGE